MSEYAELAAHLRGFTPCGCNGCWNSMQLAADAIEALERERDAAVADNAALLARMERLEADCRFLLTFVPPWAKDVPEGLAPMFYGTLTAEGDREIKERVDAIRVAFGDTLAYIEALERERDAAVADNAALLDEWCNIFEYLEQTLRPCDPGCECWACRVERLVDTPHPGAAVLARMARLEAFARRIGYSEGFEDGEYLACSDTPHCRKGETHSPNCAVYEARAALVAAESEAVP